MTTFYILRHAHKEFGGHYKPTLRHQDEPITALEMVRFNQQIP